MSICFVVKSQESTWHIYRHVDSVENNKLQSTQWLQDTFSTIADSVFYKVADDISEIHPPCTVFAAAADWSWLGTANHCLKGTKDSKLADNTVSGFIRE